MTEFFRRIGVPEHLKAAVKGREALAYVAKETGLFMGECGVKPLFLDEPRLQSMFLSRGSGAELLTAELWIAHVGRYFQAMQASAGIEIEWDCHMAGLLKTKTTDGTPYEIELAIDAEHLFMIGQHRLGRGTIGMSPGASGLFFAVNALIPETLPSTIGHDEVPVPLVIGGGLVAMPRPDGVSDTWEQRFTFLPNRNMYGDRQERLTTTLAMPSGWELMGAQTVLAAGFPISVGNGGGSRTRRDEDAPEGNGTRAPRRATVPLTDAYGE